MIEKTVAELSGALSRGDISSVELTQAYLDRINQYNSTLNAFVTVCEESALTQAAQADAARADGLTSPLLGIPLAHKDIFCTSGIKTSCGSKMLLTSSKICIGLNSSRIKLNTPSRSCRRSSKSLTKLCARDSEERVIIAYFTARS